MIHGDGWCFIFDTDSVKSVLEKMFLEFIMDKAEERK